MTARARPSLSATNRRPSSAIFIGADIPDNIPDLPGPPSPGSSSSRSGLPSPPASNSTGSGSTEDVDSVRRRPASFVNGNMSIDKSYFPKDSPTEESDEEDDNEDHTARFGVDRRRSSGTGNQNAVALERIKSLNERSRAVMDRLTFRSSRVTSPSPSNSSSRAPSMTRSPRLSSSSSSSASISSRAEPFPVRQRDHTHSGSETEREGRGLTDRFHPDSDPDDLLSVTPPSSLSNPLGEIRQRRISMPSPGKHGANGIMRSVSDQLSPGRSNTPRKRASVVLPVVDDTEEYMERYAAGTASTKRPRQPLPREFLGRTTSDELVRRENTLEARGSPSPRVGGALLSPSRSGNTRPPRATNIAARSATVREISRRQSRWMSEDLSSVPSATDGDDEDGDMAPANGALNGRRQSLRGGSAESPLAAFASGERSLVGQGLRAAGIGARRRTDDVFGPESTSVATLGRQGTPALVNGKGKSRLSDGPDVLPSRTPASRAGGSSRPGTALGYDAENPPRTAPPQLRTHKSFALPEREDRQGTATVSRSRTVLETRRLRSPRDDDMPDRRTLETPSRAGTLSRMSGAALAQSADHTRLMFNALNMFEDRLTHIPAAGTVGTSTVPEVFRSAKALAAETGRLNTILRESANRAMNEHIQASVDDERVDAGGVDAAETWRRVSGEFRESLRVSDELVRMMTEFLLGVGKALRDLGGPGDASPAQHLRAMSLDEDAVRRLTPDRDRGPRLNGGTRNGTEDSRSSGSRRSWEPAPRASSRLEGANTSRPVSAVSIVAQTPARTRKISFDDEMRSNERPAGTAKTVSSAAARRLLSPSEQRDRAMQKITGSQPMQPSDSMEAVRGDPSPSPSPAPRLSGSGERARYTSLHVVRPRPAPLPTLPSESHLERLAAKPERTGTLVHRAKPSTTSASTVRAADLKFPRIKTTALATTAVTPHSVTRSPVALPTPLDRSESSSSLHDDGGGRTGGGASNAVAFSRPSQTALSELQERQRTISSTRRERSVSGASAAEQSPESERDLRRRTMGPQGRASPALESPVGAAVGRSASGRKERRRTATEVFQR